MKYIIIGNSAAGIGAAEGIRKIDSQGEIMIITDEPHHTYSRPLISYLLKGKVTKDRMKYRGDNFYEDNHITLLNNKVVKINNNDKKVILADGTELGYDKLLTAAGSSAFVPPFAGLETVPEKFTFMCLDDARKLDTVLAKDKRVLIIGAGLIGLKCAEGILNRVAKVTVLDLAPRILSSILDDEGALIVKGHLETQGLNFILAETVEKFAEKTAFLSNGKRIDFDILVLAVGVRPNTDLLKGVAKIDRGIVINNKSETTASDIYAAGDCTQAVDISDGQSKIMALLPNAYIQGECAGINMAGGDITYDKYIPMNAIGFFGLSIITAGNYLGYSYLVNDKENKNYKKMFYDNNKLNGFILIGNILRAGIYTALIREQTPLDSINFPLILEKPGLIAFTKEERDKKLGGIPT